MIQLPRQQGPGISAIAEHTGLDRKTVRKHFRRRFQAPGYGPRSPKPSLVNPFTDYIHQRLIPYPELSADRLLREFEALGYRGGSDPLLLTPRFPSIDASAVLC